MAYEAAAFSAVGSKYGSLNQDYVVLRRLSLPGARRGTENPVILALVADGHGMLGELAAKVAGECISDHIEEFLMKKARGSSLKGLGTRKLKEVINAAFLKAHERVLDLYSSAPAKYSFPDTASLGHNVDETLHFSLEKTKTGAKVYRHPWRGHRLVEFGTTVSLSLIENGFMVVSHVGDSDVVVGSLDVNGLVSANELTRAHTAFVHSERFRIVELLDNEDEFDGYQGVTLRDDGYIEVANLGGVQSSVALSMTRAVGHRHLEEYGVIPRPEIKFYDLVDDDACIILATDGVWDAMHPRDAALFVLKRVVGNDAVVENVVAELCSICVAMQEKLTGLADNTSAVVVTIPKPIKEVSVRGGSVFLEGEQTEARDPMSFI
jgi:serine/threonine protein phosphatase PrpC